MTAPLEDRLRAHFAERTEREPLPGPDPEDALTRTLDEASRRRRRAISSNGRRNHLFLAVAAAAVLALGTVAFVVTRDDSDGVNTVDGPRRTTTTTDTTTPQPSEPSGDATSTTASSTTSSSAPASSGTTTSVVVSFDDVLGWWDGSTWVQADGAALPVEGGEQYQVLQLGQPTQSRAGELSTRNCIEEDEPTVDVGFGDTYPPFEPEPVAVTGVADPQPRPVAAVATDNAEYRTSAVEVLASLGINDPEPAVVQAVRADLDGDGADEVIVTAERISDPQGLIADEGDYSVTFLRRVASGDVASTIVTETSYGPDEAANAETPFVAPNRVATAADLNGDGQMEVVLGSHYYEGHSTVVYELQAGSLTQVIAGGCGL